MFIENVTIKTFKNKIVSKNNHFFSLFLQAKRRKRRFSVRAKSMLQRASRQFPKCSYGRNIDLNEGRFRILPVSFFAVGVNLSGRRSGKVFATQAMRVRLDVVELLGLATSASYY